MRAAERLNWPRPTTARPRSCGGQIWGGAAALATGTAMTLPIVSTISEYLRSEDATKGGRWRSMAHATAMADSLIYYDMAKEIKAISEEIPSSMAQPTSPPWSKGPPAWAFRAKTTCSPSPKQRPRRLCLLSASHQLAGKHGQDSHPTRSPSATSNNSATSSTTSMTAPNPSGQRHHQRICSAWAASPTNSILKGRRAHLTFLSLGPPAEVAALAANAMVRELGIATMQGTNFWCRVGCAGAK